MDKKSYRQLGCLLFLLSGSFMVGAIFVVTYFIIKWS